MTRPRHATSGHNTQYAGRPAGHWPWNERSASGRSARRRREGLGPDHKDCCPNEIGDHHHATSRLDGLRGPNLAKRGFWRRRRQAWRHPRRRRHVDGEQVGGRPTSTLQAEGMDVSTARNGEMRARAPMTSRGRCGSMGVCKRKPACSLGGGGGRTSRHTVGNENREIRDRRSHPIRPPVDKHGGGA